jgi:hypothetical protein
MTSARATARFTGVLYVLMGIPAVFTQWVSRALIVPGDAAATARNITAGELTWRLGVLSMLVSNIFMILLVLSLYNLLKDVDRKQARLMVMLVAVMVTLGLANLVNQIAPLILLSGADFLSVFSEPQLDALALGFLRLTSNGTYVGMAFWGLWLFPFGVLVFKSGFFPRVLGVLLIVGCVAYLTVSFTSIVLPAYGRGVNQVMLPFYAIGELSMVIWLLVKGARVQPLRTANA